LADMPWQDVAIRIITQKTPLALLLIGIGLAALAGVGGYQQFLLVGLWRALVMVIGLLVGLFGGLLLWHETETKRKQQDADERRQEREAEERMQERQAEMKRKQGEDIAGIKTQLNLKITSPDLLPQK
jgi:uncharacterized membrane protein YccC